MSKIELVADSLYHSVVITELEKRVLSTQIFNRLHNILQNSTEFLTYPAARTSRFSHSLGVVHLAGQMFFNGISNAPASVRAAFLTSIDSFLRGNSKIKAAVQTYLPDSGRDVQEKAYATLKKDPAYLSAIPGDIEGQNDRALYILTYQALRLAALFHDLGHPPFSHVTEHALGDLLDEIKDKDERGENITHREREVLQMFGYLDQNQQFHEGLSLPLTDHILHELVHSYSGDPICYYWVQIAELVRCILKDDENIFETTKGSLAATHGIVASHVDADRLDYVQRDLVMSGLRREPSKYHRLLKSYELVQDEAGYFSFMPSVRALSSLEEFFGERLRLYKYVVFHHRVTKTDFLLKEAIKDLARIYLREDLDTGQSNPRDSESPLLPENISGLWSVLDPEVDEFPRDRINHYIQWDDAWLLSVLRRHYFSLQKDAREGKSLVDRRILIVRLEEILSSKKYYRSLFKRIDTFVEVEQEFLAGLRGKFHCSDLRERLGLPPEQMELASGRATATDPKSVWFSGLERHWDEYNDVGHDELSRSFCERHGFFLTNLTRLLKISGRAGRHGLLYCQGALESVQREFGISDAILAPRDLKEGVDSDFRLASSCP